MEGSRIVPEGRALPGVRTAFTGADAYVLSFLTVISFKAVVGKYSESRFHKTTSFCLNVNHVFTDETRNFLHSVTMIH